MVDLSTILIPNLLSVDRYIQFMDVPTLDCLSTLTFISDLSPHPVVSSLHLNLLTTSFIIISSSMNSAHQFPAILSLVYLPSSHPTLALHHSNLELTQTRWFPDLLCSALTSSDRGCYFKSNLHSESQSSPLVFICWLAFRTSWLKIPSSSKASWT